jgi:hypothetical protein
MHLPVCLGKRADRGGFGCRPSKQTVTLP